jgi:DNA-binding Lrp family transcriptional regulator
VLESYEVTGPYDVIVRCTAESVDDLGKFIVGAIQKVPGITRTLTCPVVNI